MGIGITGFVPGLPFAFPLIYLAWRLKGWALLLVTTSALAPLAWVLGSDPASSRIHYPAIGAEVTVPTGWGYVHYPRDRMSYLYSPEKLARRQGTTSEQPAHPFSAEVRLTVQRVVTQHPDLVLRYEALLADAHGEVYQINESDLLQAVADGKLAAPALAGRSSLHWPPMRWLGNLMWWPLAPLAPFTMF